MTNIRFSHELALVGSNTVPAVTHATTVGDYLVVATENKVLVRAHAQVCCRGTPKVAYHCTRVTGV
jgi:hypothetical protein